MTSAELILRLRGLLNEYGITSGFYVDAVLYKYVDSAQMEVVTICKGKQDLMQKVDKGWESKVLQPLIVADSVTSLTATTTEYSLQTDFLFPYSMQLAPNFGLRKATLVSYDELLWKEDNSFAKATDADPRYYIRADKFGIAPVSEGGGTYLFYYYKKPTEITGSGTELTLRPESHNAILWFAFSYALEQDQQYQEGAKARDTAINLIKDL